MFRRGDIVRITGSETGAGHFVGMTAMVTQDSQDVEYGSTYIKVDDAHRTTGSYATRLLELEIDPGRIQSCSLLEI